MEKERSTALSMRISQALYDRLEILRSSLSGMMGKTLTLSDAAKAVLEKSRDERIGLLMDPSGSLVSLKRKYLSSQPFSQAEWAFLAGLAQQGIETTQFRNNPPAVVQARVSLAHAFHDLYLCKVGDSGQRPYYLSNLVTVSPPAGQPDGEGASDQQVLDATQDSIRRHEHSDTNRLFFIGRNLQVLLDSERFSNVTAVNTILRAHWSALWGAAARGFYMRSGKSVRSPELEGARTSQFRMFPPTTEGGFSATVSEHDDGNIGLMLSLPGPHGAMVPISGYPAIAELRAMLSSLRPALDDEPEYSPALGWSGPKFFGYFVKSGSSRGYWFRRHDNGITFGFTESEWASLRMLFDRCFEQPEVAALWQQQWWEYGDL